MPPEYNLNMAPSLIDFGTLQADANEFVSVFSINGQPPFPGPVYETVSFADFNWLRSTLNTDDCPNGCYFTALRVYYGISGNNIILIYNPLVMNLLGSNAVNDDIFSITPSSLDYATAFYTYSGGFVSVDLDTATQYITTYRNSIMIQRSGGATTHFILEDSILGDANSSMIPYQEIDCLGNVAPNPFYMVSGAVIYPPTGTYKQSVSISKVDPTSPVTPAPFVSAANYANLCPPNCGVVEVNQLTRRPNDD